MAGGQTVVYEYNDTGNGMRQVAAYPVILRKAARHPAAAVAVHKDREWAGAVRGVNADLKAALHRRYGLFVYYCATGSRGLRSKILFNNAQPGRRRETIINSMR